MFTIGINEMWHFWFVEEIFSVPNHWMFNMGVVVTTGIRFGDPKEEDDC
jgi:hypothetical protein